MIYIEAAFWTAGVILFVAGVLYLWIQSIFIFGPFAVFLPALIVLGIAIFMIILEDIKERNKRY